MINANDMEVLAAAHAERAQHLAGMLPAARRALDEHGPGLAAALLTRILLVEEDWSRDDLANILGAAVVALAGRSEVS